MYLCVNKFISLTELAFPVGLEPTTYSLEDCCSLLLSYENFVVLSPFVLGYFTPFYHRVLQVWPSRILSRSIGSDHNVTSFSSNPTTTNGFHGIISNYGDICWSLVISQILNDILTSFFLLSTSNNQLNEEFNQFVLKILNEIRTVLTDVRTISDLGNVPALKSPPQPPSNSEMLELISERIQELTVHGGPKEVERENPWIHPTHGYLFG